MTIEPRKQKEAEFHDRMRGVYEQDRDKHGEYVANLKFYEITHRSREHMNDWLLTNCRNKSVLDFGCGSGETSLTVLPTVERLHGIDISSESIKICTDKAAKAGFGDRAVFEVRDCENTGFDDGSFDVVFESGVLHHLDVRAAYSEMARVLKPGGKAICMEALRHNPLIHRYRKKTPQMRTEWEVEHILGEPEIDLAMQYFESIDKRFFHLFALMAVPLRKTRLFMPVLRILEAVDRVILRIPWVRRQAWICIYVLENPRK